MKITGVSGKITVETPRGKEEVSFSLSREYGWQKWGASFDSLVEAGPITDAMQDAAYEFLASEYDEDES